MTEKCHRAIELAGTYLESLGGTTMWPDRDHVLSHVTSDVGYWELEFKVVESPALLCCFAKCPVYVPEVRRAIAAELLTRMNWGMALGAFEMSMKSGEVFCKHHLPIGEQPLEPEALARIGFAINESMDHAIPALVELVHDGWRRQTESDAAAGGYWARMKGRQEEAG